MSESTPPTKTTGLSVDAIVDSPPTQFDPAIPAVVAGEREDLKNQLRKSKLQDRAQDRRERFRFGRHIFLLLVGWLIVLGLVVLAEGFHPLGFHLSDPVMLALVGGTNVSVVGIFLIVANYLFAREQRQKT